MIKQRVAVLTMLHEITEDLNRRPEAMYEVGLKWIRNIRGLGPNIFTEFCHTFRPDLYAILNDNPVTSLFELELEEFPEPSRFGAADYARFCRCIAQLGVRCGFADLGEVDHFLNSVYWRHKLRVSELNANER